MKFEFREHRKSLLIKDGWEFSIYKIPSPIREFRIGWGGAKINPFLHYPKVATHFQIYPLIISIIYTDWRL